MMVTSEPKPFEVEKEKLDEVAKILAERSFFESHLFNYEANLPPTTPFSSSDIQDLDRDITVCIRTRPVLPQEDELGYFNAVNCRNPSVHVHKLEFKWNKAPVVRTQKFEADYVFGPEHKNEIHDVVVQKLLPVALGGGTGTIFAYGQTGSGKTYTVSNILNQIANDMFEKKEEHEIFVQFFEIFGSQDIFDLLNERKKAQILEDVHGSVVIKGCQEELVLNPNAFLDLVERGVSLRRTESTHKNDSSSRSHAICRIRIKNTAIPEAEDGILNIVDLAGSESASDMKYHDRDRIKETQEINKSLATLKDCIRNRALSSLAMSQDKHVHIPYRSSKLTLYLKDAFDLASHRQCRTVVIANISPSITDVSHSLNTLRYINPLKVPAPSTPPKDPKNPATWNNAEFRVWVAKTYPDKLIDPEILCPFESGLQMCRLSEAEFLSRCLKCPGVDRKKAKTFYLKLWDLVIEARTKKRASILTKAKPKTLRKAPNQQNPKTSSSTDLSTKLESKTAQPLGKVYEGGTFVYVSHEYYDAGLVLQYNGETDYYTIAVLSNVDDAVSDDTKKEMRELMVEICVGVKAKNVLGRIDGWEYDRKQRLYKVPKLEA